eukprot:CAMPEP_0201525540 /NCGR_PEP_ID=MMETSP0161_2-20130828/28615_1 /ASSEMBLY_ACC=CAM_ASM_000251 /TAXON_ID=180227 /ORGANISM="Neoparamoeba aestuarina, Strain SoJaBio B1-5/56/2" /LENGTH=74 /DNA_ID=CAMNT_0047925507 /DNA_START=43 /DNA_END=264 /DNA_ORIENTATION=+
MGEVEPSRCIVLDNMVRPKDVDEDLEPDVRDEASKFGVVEKIDISVEGDIVRIYILYEDVEGATKGLKSLHGRW